MIAAPHCPNCNHYDYPHWGKKVGQYDIEVTCKKCKHQWVWSHPNKRNPYIRY